MELPANLDQLAVVHNEAAQQFEIPVEYGLCVLQYRVSAGKMIVYHTEVPPFIQGRGLAAQMTREALGYARRNQLKVEPRCPYTAAFMHKNREYSELLA